MVKRIIIRWAIRQIQKIANSNESYAYFAKYGIEDAIKTKEGEDAFIFSTAE